jgi:multidrug efflux pump subunit AcrB
MNGLIRWFASNHVAANLLMLVLVLGGLLTIPGLRQEMIPDIELDLVTISVPYPGATPSEVEEAICVRVEEALGSPASSGSARRRSRAWLR